MRADRLCQVSVWLLLVAPAVAAERGEPATSRALRHDPFSRGVIQQIVQTAPTAAAAQEPASAAAESVQARTAAASRPTAGVPSVPSAVAAVESPPVLRALLRSGSRPMANVDGQLLEIGDSVDGMRLVKIGDYSATFIKGRKTIELALGGATTP